MGDQDNSIISSSNGITGLFSGLYDILISLQENDPTVITEISGNLIALSNDIAAQSEDNKKVLLKQAEVKEIINAENDRIQTNINTIADNLVTKDRMIRMNENLRMRTEQYNQMLYVFSIGLLAIIGVIILFRRLPYIPYTIAYSLFVIIGSVTLVQIGILYKTLQSRSPIDYNKIDFDNSPPTSLGVNVDLNLRGVDASMPDIVGQCIGTNVVWSDGICKPVTPPDDTDGFTTERITYNQNMVKPNCPSEINVYTLV